jgi:uncharacterized protein (DUF58 family)
VTARRLSSSPGAFQVNEFEKEGKKAVWIFLDTAAHMALGTTVRNTLEHAVRAALGFTDFYLNRECQVGLCFYDYDAHEWEGTYQQIDIFPSLDEIFSDVDQIEESIETLDISTIQKRRPTSSRIIFPDIGRKQQFRIMREMVNVDIKYGGESLKEAIIRCRGHIVGTSPLFIIITMLDTSKSTGLFEGIRELHKYIGRMRRNPNIIIFNIQGYNVAASRDVEEIASELLHYHNRPLVSKLRNMGATVVNWDPENQSFAQALIQQRA